MKILSKSKYMSFGPIVLNKLDIVRIFQLLPDNKEKEFIVDGIQYDDASEFNDKCEAAKNISISVHRPYISVNLFEGGARVYISDEGAIEYGSYARICEYIKKLERRPRIFYRFSSLVSVYLALNVVIAMLDVYYSEKFGAFLFNASRIIVFSVFLWFAHIVIGKKVVFDFGKKSSILHGKKVDLGIAIASAVLGAVLGAVLAPVGTKYVGEIISSQQEKR